MLDKVKMSEPVWLDQSSCDINAFSIHQSQQSDPADYPQATQIARQIPIYDGAALLATLRSDEQWRAVTAEWNRAFRCGPGIIVIRAGYTDFALLDKATRMLESIIEKEEAGNAGKGDHFAAAGANSRIWNAHEKLCMKDPELFARYNTSELVRRVSEAWLGQGYQITTQVNVVRPGGKAQTVHRDYHMGFQTIEQLRTYPASQHALSAQLTLQGAIAHCEVSIDSGPTKLLPYSQSYLPGYLAVQLPEFQSYFEEHHVQLPLGKGDMLFFNPATFHAAGENRTRDVHRFVNLMQIGSAYGRSIEIVDRLRMSKAVYARLCTLSDNGEITVREADNVIAATAEGYPFPTNLDIDSPLSGMAPPSQQDVMRQALIERWSTERFAQALDDQAGRKRSY